ncbi:M14 family metallopeptidase [Blastopirellula sp. JC732]|uniref:M14 family metallopeptidase n=1 Tax=Blastopirellula sediminis TaxID=2894196 RepID=A0A9X1MKT9_9BACT|nr:M14 family metallopeptidase [Blastopirellula sediminis]MCC9609759.1 M14 family metallopeptidase [Blastopirellula sediminis]MCC9629003.1 M14 family metallopeptidase [Blastopirellula sediminis]
MSVPADAWFPRDYAESRREFLAACKELGGEMESHAIDAVGPDGESLTIDLLTLGNRGANDCLVLSSGLHGLEAPLGAAIQLHWMRNALSQSVPPNLRIVLIHALNPYGFAHRRRCEAENIDLNRSFMRRGEEHRGAPPLYEKLDPLLNPESPPGGFDFFTLRAAAILARYGMTKVKQAIAGGQYEFPRGLFYGGKGASETQQLLTPHWKSWLGESRRVIHLDVHTGLGRWGELTLLSAPAMDTAWHRQVGETLGETGYDREKENSVAYQARGDFGLWCSQQAGDIDYAYFCAEFGTYPAVRVLKALRAENQAHHWSDPKAAAFQTAKRSALEAFSPASKSWRQSTVARGVDLCKSAIARLEK